MANPPSRKHGWRHGAQTPKSQSNEKAWQQDQVPGPQVQPWWMSRRARLCFAFGSLLFVIATIIVVIYLWNPVKPVHLVLIGPNYKTNLFVPHNVAGWNGVQQLDLIYQNGKWEQNKWGQVQEKSEFVENLDALKEKLDPNQHTVNFFGSPKQTVIVYVSAHGVARFKDEALTPYLIPEDYLNSTSSYEPYCLDDLLDLLDKLPPATPKLLLLDVTQVSAHWPLGEFHNDFARALENSLEKKYGNIQNLVVISSSDKDQRSWVSPEWQQTYFTHFVLEGLKGAANKDGDNRVDAKELYDYVSAEVPRWVLHNRQQVQKPRMFGDDSVAKRMQLVGYTGYRASKDNPNESQEKQDDPDGNQENNPKPEVEALKVAKGLTERWEKCQDLRNGSPYPAVNAPLLWRLYLDKLLRAEQLWRAGAAYDAGRMLEDVDQLFELIAKPRFLDNLKKTSAQLTLAMPGAVDVPLSKAFEPLAEETRNVANNRSIDPDKVGASLKKQAADAQPAVPRPAEIHYLLMMLGKTPSPIAPLLRDDVPLVQQSLQVRLRAEQAALGLGGERDGNKKMPAYSEQVQPWIKTMIEKADEQRRLGQDLLLFQTKQWAEAKTHLGKAQDDYTKAQTQAFAVRRALAVRDEVHAELPYYTHWVAEDGAEQENRTKELWSYLYDLESRLDKQTPELDKLDELHDRIAKSFGELKTAFDNRVKSVSGQRDFHPARWHQIEAVLAVPFLSASERTNLIANSSATSGTLWKNTDQTDTRVIAEGDAKQAREKAQRQGNLALAVVGASGEEHRTIKEWVKDAADQDADWRKLLTLAGTRLGRQLNELPENIGTDCDKAAASGDLGAADALLREAVAKARTVEAAAYEIRMKKKDPFDLKRCLDWHHLLSVQAERTYLDWWAEWKPGQPHYYQRAAGVFLNDANTLVLSSDFANKRIAAVCQNRIEQLRNKVDKRQEVVVKVAPTDKAAENEFKAGKEFDGGGPTVNLTDEPQGVVRYYRLFGPDVKDVPGRPVLWVDPTSGLKRVNWERISAQCNSKDSIPLTIAEDREQRRQRSGSQPLNHVVHGFFRGHDYELKSDVHLHQDPNVTYRMPLKQGGGSVAVQTKESLYKLFAPERSAISIVLDCSGSMRSPNDYEGRYRYDPKDRFHLATKALDSVLKELPAGVTVSLRVFGAWKDDPTNVHPEQERIEVLWPQDKWDPERREELMNQVDRLQPHWFTPLLRSIRDASRDFEQSDSDDLFQSRTVLVLTDGGDSQFYNGNKADDLKEQSGAQTITRYVEHLKQIFERKSIQLVVIGFDVKQTQLPKMEREPYVEFQTAMKRFGFVYEDAENPDALKRTLRNTLLRSYFRVDPEHREWRSVSVRRSAPITQSNEGRFPDYIPVPPDDYRIRVPSIRNLQQSIVIDPGDVLLLELAQNEGASRPVFRQSLYAESLYLHNVHRRDLIKSQSKDGWLFAVLQNQQLEDSDRLKILATLQKEPGKVFRDDIIKQRRPQWSWFEVPSAQTGSVQPPLTITSVSNYPAPAWDLDVRFGQPREMPVKINAWWHNLPNEPLGILQKGPPLSNEKWPDVPLHSVLLESLAIEKHEILVEEERPMDKTECLVVRLSYPPGQDPYFVRWPGWRGGQEHRFYIKAGKYTGLFWSTRKTIQEKVDRELKSLELYSVAELKKKASHVKELDLGPPRETSERPERAPVGKYSFSD